MAFCRLQGLVFKDSLHQRSKIKTLAPNSDTLFQRTFCLEEHAASGFSKGLGLGCLEVLEEAKYWKCGRIVDACKSSRSGVKDFFSGVFRVCRYNFLFLCQHERKKD